MKIPKYMKKKIMQRAILQQKCNNLQIDIEEWCEKRGIELEYAVTHVCLYIEPSMVAQSTIEEIEKA